jgi:hypothetical protein
MTVNTLNPGTATAELKALAALIRGLARQLEPTAAAPSGLRIDPDEPAGLIARRLWQVLGRRRALIVCTKIEALARADTKPATMRARDRRHAGNGHRPPVSYATNGNGHTAVGNGASTSFT